MKYYIATGLDNWAQHNMLRDQLAFHGHEITYDWTVHGSVKGSSGARLREVADKELQGIRDADFVVVLLPGGRGTHAELGAANILAKPVFIFAPAPTDYFQAGPYTCAFYWNSNVVTLYTDDVSEMVAVISGEIAHV